jgi:phosphoribosylaminoimidazole-succinocarboxamide synthase
VIAGPALNETELPLKLFARGKVRDTYELGPDQLLMVATDRISAFDHVLANGIPDRGKVLTQLSIFWFSQTDTFQANHLISGMVPDLPASLREFRDKLAGRFMIVRKAKRIDYECVVRGFLAGSAWKEYEGIADPRGRTDAARPGAEPEARCAHLLAGDQGGDRARREHHLRPHEEGAWR